MKKISIDSTVEEQIPALSLEQVYLRNAKLRHCAITVGSISAGVATCIVASCNQINNNQALVLYIENLVVSTLLIIANRCSISETERKIEMLRRSIGTRLEEIRETLEPEVLEKYKIDKNDLSSAAATIDEGNEVGNFVKRGRMIYDMTVTIVHGLLSILR